MSLQGNDDMRMDIEGNHSGEKHLSIDHTIISGPELGNGQESELAA